MYVHTLQFSMHGQMAQAALACTSGLEDLSSDHSSLTPSDLSITLQQRNTKVYTVQCAHRNGHTKETSNDEQTQLHYESSRQVLTNLYST